MTRTTTRRAAAAAAIAFALTAAYAPLSAIVVVDSKTGLFGVTSDQTIRVSVLNAGTRGGIVPCTKVFDITGALLAEADGRVLEPGEGMFVDFDAAALGLRDGVRTQLRIEVEFETPPDPNRPILTLEVIDNDSGRTAFVVPWVWKGFNRQPEPPAGP
jgi:hypothetical protein